MRFGLLARRPAIVAAGLYTALALLWCRQLLVAGLSRALPNDLGDPLLVTWMLWWNSRAPLLSEQWWNAPAFFPAPGVLSFSETMLSVAVLTNPLMWLGLSPVTAYNLAFIFSFAASATTAYWLCRECTGSHLAALVGGAYFGFGPHRAAHVPQLQILWAFWMPLFFLALFRYRATRRPLDLALVGVSWLGVALSSVYSLLYVGLAAALWSIWFLPRGRGMRLVPPLLGVSIIASTALVPLFRSYADWHKRYGFRRTIGEIEAFSADASSILDGSHLLWTWPNLESLDRPEGALYPGIFTACLLALGGWQWGRTRAKLHGSMRTSAVLASVATVIIIAALVAEWGGGWQWRLGPLSVSITTAYKPIGVAALLLMGAALFLPRVQSSWRSASVVGFWISCAVATYILALGPTAHVLGYRFWYKAPYSWLMALPWFDSARVPARIGTVMALALAVLVAIAIARIQLARPRRWLPGVALVCVLSDGALTIAAVPMQEAVDAHTWGADAVLEIPLDTYRDAAAMAGSFRHGLPVINGYSGFEPPHYLVLSAAVREGGASVMDELRRFATLAVVVDGSTEEGRPWLSLLRSFHQPGLAASHGRSVYILPRVLEPDRCLAQALASGVTHAGIASLVALSPNQSPDELALTIDGDPTTFYTVTESAVAGEGVEVTMNLEQPVAGVVLWMGPVPNDYPGHLRVTVDGAEGVRTTFEGDVAGRALAGALAQPTLAPVAVCFPVARARTLVVSMPLASKRPWSVAEISVLAPP